MRKLDSNTAVRLRDIGASDNWSVFAAGVSGDVEIKVSPEKDGTYVTALTITEDGVHTAPLSRGYWIKVDTSNADEVWVG